MGGRMRVGMERSMRVGASYQRYRTDTGDEKSGDEEEERRNT